MARVRPGDKKRTRGDRKSNAKNRHEVLYERYINSSQWQAKRELVLARDNGRCVLCDSNTDLEIHHRNYDRLGNEDLSDLTTLCRDCHEVVTDMIRRRRYKKKGWKDVPDSLRTAILFKMKDDSAGGWEPIRENQTGGLPRPLESKKGSENVFKKFELPDSRPMSYPTPQRSDGRPAEPLCEGNQENIGQAKQD